MRDTEEFQLPEGIVLLSGPNNFSDLGLRGVEIIYRMHGLELKIGWTVSPPDYFKAPDRLSISSEQPLVDYMESDADRMSAHELEMFGGITTQFLREIPMAHARHLLRPAYEALSVGLVREDMLPMPSRIESDEDYVHVACAYVDLVTGPSAEPIRWLSEWTGVKGATWSARLQRARARGILVGRGRSASISPQFKALEQGLRARLWERRRS
ncbi:hypothetical protein ACSBOX_04540 [Arthrobacter sp. KN11-1C]|uniref:hypothetical protein n=1 Tax=Arthrobacter sp. KN11-1C TaxID=3445774 RepID=UPI003F9EC323